MIFFAFFLFQQLFSIQGTVSSIHFDKLDDLHVSISSSIPKGKFDTKLPKISVSENSNFQVHIFEPGLYSLYTRAPYHEVSFLSFLVDRPDSIIVDIIMDAIAVEDGEFFPDPEYVKWIDVMGNFNDWDSETAIPFTFDAADSSIYCVIPSNLDTVWYRIYGLNTMVLPGADAYKITRVQGREVYIAALIPENGEVVLRYRPGEYPFPKPKGHRYERSLYY